MSQSLKRKAGLGSVINISAGMMQVLIRLFATFFLARILLPEDFGIVAYATLVYGLFSQLTAMGASVAIITKKDITQKELSTAFWFNILFFTFLGSMLFFNSSYIGGFFNEPKIIPVLQFFSIMFIPAALSSVSNTLLNKEMKFMTLNVITLIGVSLESLIAIILIVYYDYNYWGIIIGMVSAELFMSLLQIYLAHWRPSFSFDISILKYFVNFGVNLTGERLLTYIRHNVDYLMIGKLLSSKDLGFYSFAYRIPNLVYSKLAIPASSVLLPYIMKKSETDDYSLGKSYVKLTKYIAFITYPLLFGVLFLAEPMVLVFWGEQWQSIVIPLQILCFAPMVYILSVSMGTIFLVKERPDLLFKIEIVKLLITFSLVLLLGYFWSLVGVALGMAMSALITFIISLVIAFKSINMKIYYLFEEVLPIFIASLITGLGAHFVYVLLNNEFNIYISFFLSILIGAIFYYLVFLILFKKTYNEIFDLIKVVLHGK